MSIDFTMITTRGGDSGKSSLFGGERRLKSEPIFAVLGELDELTSALGLCRSALNTIISHTSSQTPPEAISRMSAEVRDIQQDLQNILSLMATPVSDLNTIKPLGRTDEGWTSYLRSLLENLEEREARYMENIQLSGFIIPGDLESSARIDFARAICRRAERTVIIYIQSLPTDYYRLVQNYLNRLSDYLFVIARYLEQNPVPG